MAVPERDAPTTKTGGCQFTSETMFFPCLAVHPLQSLFQTHRPPNLAEHLNCNGFSQYYIKEISNLLNHTRTGQYPRSHTPEAYHCWLYSNLGTYS